MNVKYSCHSGTQSACSCGSNGNAICYIFESTVISKDLENVQFFGRKIQIFKQNKPMSQAYNATFHSNLSTPTVQELWPQTIQSHHQVHLSPFKSLGTSGNFLKSLFGKLANHIDASNANYLEINCYNGAQCDAMAIECPSSSTLNDDYFDDNNNARPCTINIVMVQRVKQLIKSW